MVSSGDVEFLKHICYVVPVKVEIVNMQRTFYRKLCDLRGRTAVVV